MLVSPYDMVRVQSGSMAPTFKAGDAVIIDEHAPPRIGDVIAYKSSVNGLTITHRVIKLTSNHTIQTKGDNVPAADIPITSKQVLGRVVIAVGGLGAVADLLHRPLGLIIGVGVPLTFVLIAETLNLARRLQSHNYRAVHSH